MRSIYTVVLIIGLWSIGSLASAESENTSAGSANTGSANTESANKSSVHHNQLGFVENRPKFILAPAQAEKRFHLSSESTGEAVYSGPLSEERRWPVAAKGFKLIDFSGFNFSGDYVLKIDGVEGEVPVTIGASNYENALKAAIKAFYFNRSSTSLHPQYAGAFQRPAGHPDTIVYVHKSAADERRPADFILNMPKGWYDAGDYGKYSVNASNALYFLMRAYLDYPSLFINLNTGIPESGNKLPDLVDEILWALEWLERMQDPSDGGVYHKLTSEKFSGEVMPHEHIEKRYVVMKTTEASLCFAATMALAHRLFANFELELPRYSERYLLAAKRAMDWAEKNQQRHFVQPEGFETGKYSFDSDDFKDERLFAQSELFLSTGKRNWLDLKNIPQRLTVPSWHNLEALAMLNLYRSEKTPDKLKETSRSLILSLADTIVQQSKNSEFGLAMEESDFIWGSNSVALNKAYILYSAYRMEPKRDYQRAAWLLIDYIFGLNPTGYSFVTGFGTKSPKYIHHRISQADTIEAPVPGLLVGGPSKSGQDLGYCRSKGKRYELSFPANAYFDDWCSYATNEVAINWNAVLVYILSAVNAEG